MATYSKSITIPGELSMFLSVSGAAVSLRTPSVLTMMTEPEARELARALMFAADAAHENRYNVGL